MAKYSYHTIQSLYDELSKYPKDKIVFLGLPQYLHVEFQGKTVQTYNTVDETKQWNNLAFSETTTSNEAVLAILEKHLKTHGDCTVTCGLLLLYIQRNEYIHFAQDRITNWYSTHLNDFSDLKQIEKDYLSLITILGNIDKDTKTDTKIDMEIVYCWLDKKLKNHNVNAYMIEKTVFFYFHKVCGIYDMFGKEHVDKVFVKHEKYQKIHICKLSEKEMKETFTYSELQKVLLDKLSTLTKVTE